MKQLFCYGDAFPGGDISHFTKIRVIHLVYKPKYMLSDPRTTLSLYVMCLNYVEVIRVCE